MGEEGGVGIRGEYVGMSMFEMEGVEVVHLLRKRKTEWWRIRNFGNTSSESIIIDTENYIKTTLTFRCLCCCSPEPVSPTIP